MAAPLLLWPLISAALGWLASLGVHIVKWVADHWHAVKIVIVCSLVIAAFALSIRAYTFVCEYFDVFGEQITSSLTGLPGTGGSSAEFLSILNVVLPISEAFALLAAYCGIAATCFGIRCVLTAYNLVPHKNT